MRRVFMALLVALVAPLALRAQMPYLVKDINLTTAVGTESSFPYGFFPYGSQVYFVADNNNGGYQLWSTDGTAAGTVQLTGSGSVSLVSPSFAVLNGKLLFNATDIHGEELWITDGTKAGTRLLADINSGSLSSSPHDRIVYHNKMIFSADDGVDGRELWITDGTPAGTMFFKDLAPGPDGSEPGSFVLLNDVIYFSAAGGLWKSDGTPGGTVQVIAQVNPLNLTVVGTQIFFFGDSDQTGYRPWVSDGTAAGTHAIGLTIDDQGFFRLAFTPFGGRVLFTGSDPQHGAEPWVSDGTASGTHILRDVNPGSAGSVGGNGLFVVAGNVAYFVATSTDGNSIWKTDGTEAGTTEVPGASDTAPISLAVVGNKLYFIALSGGGLYSGGVYTLWVTDGTASGLRLVKTTNPQFYVSEGTGLTNVNGILYFTAANALNGYEPWKSDGTDSGTAMIANLAPDESPSSSPGNLTAAADWVYFDAWDGFGTIQSDNGGPRSLWRSDGTHQGTLKLVDSPYPAGYVAAGRSLFFNKDGVLWTSDGTPEGTVPAKAFVNRFPKSPTIISVLGDTIFASVSGSLWATTTTANAPAVSLGSQAPFALIEVAGHEMFFANGGLWTTDGTPAGTYAVVPVIAESISSGTAVVGGLFYFDTYGSTSGPKLWKSDGTFEGTVPVKVFPSGSVGSLVAAGRSLFFTLFNSNAPTQLWVSDGTDTGTHVLPAAPSGTLAATGHGVVFSANDPVNGYELWGSDGTADGTHLLRDIFPGLMDSSPSNLTAVDGVVYFTASDDVHYGELWMTDGTASGTTLVADIEPGTGSSYPRQYVRAGGLLFFTANTSATGDELWALPLASTPQIAINDTRLAEGDSGITTARFTVTLAPASTQTVTVNYATSDGTATAGSDYDANSGTLTFAPGETSKNIGVAVHGETTPENNETFFVTLSNAAGATLTKSLGFAIIDDDDQFADLSLALDFSSFPSQHVVTVASNHGPRAATSLKVQTTVTPVSAASSCVGCSSPLQPLAPGATAHVFDFQQVGSQQYLTATVTARQTDPLPSNNSVGWIASGPVAMDALYLTPGSQATVWFSYFQSFPATSLQSSNPAVLSVPASLTTPAGVNGASFIASGLSVGTATIRVLNSGTTIGTLTVDVVASGARPRWPGAVIVQPGNSASFDQPVDFKIFNTATAPYSGQAATGLVTISASGQELGRTTLPLTSGTRDVPIYLPAIGTTTGTVDYAGDANFLPMSTLWTVTAFRGYVTVTSNASRNGTTATIHLRVTGSPVASPTGTVTVSEPGIIPSTQATLTAVAGAGQADITLTNVTPGVHTLVVNYSGDTRYNTGTQNIRLLEEHRHVGPH